MPTEVCDSGALERRVPSLRVELLGRPSQVAEHVRGMLPQLPANQGYRVRIQRRRNRPPRRSASFSMMRSRATEASVAVELRDIPRERADLRLLLI
jgi:hypothetical protein